MPQATFRATLQLDGKTATGICVPAEAVAALGSGRQPLVRATLGDHTYRSRVAVRGGDYKLPVSAEVRAAAGVAAGDEVDVRLVLDAEPRALSIPADLAAALERDAAARRAFETLSYSRQKAHVLSVESAKTDATRERRIAKALAALVPQRSSDTANSPAAPALTL